ncbi:septation protein SepH [Mariniluteicoccus flavus]
MRIAHPLGLSADGAVLVVETDDGEQLGVPADERLRAALRRDRPRMGQLEIEMDSALRPSEIQTRIRSGQSLDEVARAAGVPPEKIEPFAAPVLAEREHVAGIALSSSVRRRGETHAHRTLRQVVAERLLSRGIDADDVDWDAWRNDDRRWTVRAAYSSGSADREALFLFDKAARFSSAANDDARWLISEPSPATGPQPGRKGHRYDDTDELALVRAVADEDLADAAEPGQTAGDTSDNEPTERLPEPRATLSAVPPAADDATDEERGDEPGEARSVPSPQEIGDEVEAELDAFDVIPEGQSELDVLYDMLGGIAEDSINIYAGLNTPVVASEEAEPPAERAERVEAPESTPSGRASRPGSEQPRSAPAPQGETPASTTRRSRPAAAAGFSDPEQPSLVDEAETGDEPAGTSPVETPAAIAEKAAVVDPEAPPVAESGAGQSAPTKPAPSEPAPSEPAPSEPAPTKPAPSEPAPTKPAPSEPQAAEPQAADAKPDDSSAPQAADAMPDDSSEPPPAAPKPPRKPARKKGRASVPSWDEIMFGGPQTK